MFREQQYGEHAYCTEGVMGLRVKISEDLYSHMIDSLTFPSFIWTVYP